MENFPSLTSNGGGPLAIGADSFRFFNSAAAEPGIGSSRKKLSTAAAGFGFAFGVSGFFLTTGGAGGESTAVAFPVEPLSLGDAFAAAFLVGERCSSSVSKSL